MIDEKKLTPEQKALRAQQAEQLLKNPLLVEAFANLRQSYYETFISSEPEAEEIRDVAYRMNRVVAEVEQHLRLVIAHGKLERAHIERGQAVKASKASAENRVKRVSKSALSRL